MLEGVVVSRDGCRVGVVSERGVRIVCMCVHACSAIIIIGNCYLLLSVYWDGVVSLLA